MPDRRRWLLRVGEEGFTQAALAHHAQGWRAFVFAGLWERWEKAPDGVPVDSCTIITTAANALVAKLHDRMPVILAPETYGAWLGEDSAAPPELHALLKPFPPDAMRAYPVSTVVNSPKNDTPECVEEHAAGGYSNRSP